MKHFKRVTADIDIAPFLDEIDAHPELWAVDSSRQKGKPAQRETQSISIRSHEAKAILDSEARVNMPVGYRGRPTSLSPYFPVAVDFVEQLVDGMKGAMGRAVIALLKPNGTIYPHIDDRLYWLLRDRYHLVIKSVSGSHFRAGGEEVRMQTGELWWFDPTVTHEAFNDSEEERIHIIVDVLSAHSIGSFCMRLVRAPVRSLHAVGGAVLRGLRGPAKKEKADSSG
jgi:hypothetical protein